MSIPDPARPVLLDTCAAIWLMARDPIAEIAQTALRSARASQSGIHVSPFTAWEVGMLAAKGRLRAQISADVWFAALLAISGVRLTALTPEILLNSTHLPGMPPNDPADRILAATARAFGYPIVTRDRLLVDYADQGHIQ